MLETFLFVIVIFQKNLMKVKKKKKSCTNTGISIEFFLSFI